MIGNQFIFYKYDFMLSRVINFHEYGSNSYRLNRLHAVMEIVARMGFVHQYGDIDNFSRKKTRNLVHFDIFKLEILHMENDYGSCGSLNGDFF